MKQSNHEHEEAGVEVRLLMPAGAGLAMLRDMADAIGCDLRVESFGRPGVYRVQAASTNPKGARVKGGAA